MKKPRERSKSKRILIDIAGILLVIISPFFGWVPGPGGIPIFLAGLGLLATNHEWAKHLLENFDEKRIYYTDKLLMGGVVQTAIIDISCVLVFSAGLYINLMATHLWLRGLGFALCSISLIVILCNRKRFDRILAKFKH